MFGAQGKDDPAHPRRLAAEHQGQTRALEMLGSTKDPRQSASPPQAPIFAAVKGGFQNEWVLTGR